MRIIIIALLFLSCNEKVTHVGSPLYRQHSPAHEETYIMNTGEGTSTSVTDIVPDKWVITMRCQCGKDIPFPVTKQEYDSMKTYHRYELKHF
jgi:hypothetical protein